MPDEVGFFKHKLLYEDVCFFFFQTNEKELYFPKIVNLHVVEIKQI